MSLLYFTSSFSYEFVVRPRFFLKKKQQQQQQQQQELWSDHITSQNCLSQKKKKKITKLDSGSCTQFTRQYCIGTPKPKPRALLLKLINPLSSSSSSSSSYSSSSLYIIISFALFLCLVWLSKHRGLYLAWMSFQISKLNGFVLEIPCFYRSCKSDHTFFVIHWVLDLWFSLLSSHYIPLGNFVYFGSTFELSLWEIWFLFHFQCFVSLFLWKVKTGFCSLLDVGSSYQWSHSSSHCNQQRIWLCFVLLDKGIDFVLFL